MRMLSSFTCLIVLIHLLNSPVVSQIARGERTSSTGDTIVYHIQRDGKVMESKEGSLNRTEITKRADPFLMHYPVGDIQTGTSNSSAPAPKKVKIIHTNALIQHLPDGTKVGDLVNGKTKQQAYPWNPIVSESPATLKSASLRPKKSIDQIIEKTVGSAVSHYPTKSGQILTELDIVMTNAQYQYYYGGRNLVKILQKGSRGRRFKRKALRFRFTYWPNAVIPYTVDSSFSASERRLLRSSMADWTDKTCIRFVPARQEHYDVLSIQNGQGCNSFVGRIGGRQSLNLEPACREYHVMMHELGHVIGLIHEHQRPDRDNYIIVARDNVGTGRLKNYRKFAPNRINTYGVDYDYTSIMHYGKTAFSKDDHSTTMITRNPDFQEIIGTTSTVSFKDAKVVNAMYDCSGHCFTKPNCGIGYVDKNCRCVCPDGTQRCQRRSNFSRNGRQRFWLLERFAGNRRRQRQRNQRLSIERSRRERQKGLRERRQRNQNRNPGSSSTNTGQEQGRATQQLNPTERTILLQRLGNVLHAGRTVGSGQTARLTQGQGVSSLEPQQVVSRVQERRDLGFQAWPAQTSDPFAPDFTNVINPDLNSFNNPDLNSFNNPDQHSFNNPDQHSFNNPDLNTFNNPDLNTFNNPDLNTFNNPDLNTFNNPDFNSFNIPDFNSFNSPDLTGAADLSVPLDGGVL